MLCPFPHPPKSVTALVKKLTHKNNYESDLIKRRSENHFKILKYTLPQFLPVVLLFYIAAFPSNNVNN